MSDNHTSDEKHFLEIYRNSIVNKLKKDNNLNTLHISQFIFPEQCLLYYNQAPDRYLYIMFKPVVYLCFLQNRSVFYNDYGARNRWYNGI